MGTPQVLLIGKRNEESVGLKHTLSKSTGYGVELATVAQRAIQRLTTGHVDLCVFNLDMFTKEKIKLASDLRALGYEFPVLVLSRIIASEAYHAIQNMHNTILLEKPFEQKDLLGLSDKLIAGRNVSQRHYRRFYTYQKTQIAPFDGGTAIDAKMYNLSRGGAYLEIIEEKQATVKKGDVLKLKVQLGEVQRQYNINARVIWATSSGMWGSGSGVGVEFLKAGDVYRELLHKI